MNSTVLFLDLDDTLVNSTLAYDIAMSRIGIDPQDPTFLNGRAKTKAKLPKSSPQARSRFLYFKSYLELKNQYTPETHLNLALSYEKEVISILKAEWLSLGRDELFQSIRTKAQRIYLVTNETTRMQTLKLAAFDPKLSLFSGLITSEEVGHEKPSAKIFDYALSAAKVQDPSSVIMIGDSFENDIEPALKLGMRAILTEEFTTLDSIPSQGFLRIPNLNKLIDHLR